MPFYSASDFDTLFDATSGFADGGRLIPLNQDPYDVNAIFDDSVEIVDELGGVKERAKTLMFLRVNTNAQQIERGAKWVRTSDSKIYIIQTLVETDEFIDQYEVTGSDV